MKDVRVPHLLLLSILIGLIAPITKLFASEKVDYQTAHLKEIWFEEDNYENNANAEAELLDQAYQRNTDLDSFRRAKFNMINGELKLAKFYLARITNQNSKLYIIKKRYLAIIYFIEGRFLQSLEELNHFNFNESLYYPQVCLLKIINYMAINDLKSLKFENETCMKYMEKKSKNNAYWLDTMINFKLKNALAVKRNLTMDEQTIFANDEMAKLWLKAGLYLNQEKSLLELLSNLSETSYQSKRLREIVAFMYLRSNQPENKMKALAFIEDLDSANAENIKGIINLQNKEYELAFGHFKLALLKKHDSSNALARGIPLAYILGEWKDGLKMLEYWNNPGVDQRNKRAIKIAFLIRDKNFAAAKKELDLLKIDFQYHPPLEVIIMDSYLSIIAQKKVAQDDSRSLEELLEKSCKAFDGISCWISMQFVHWSQFEKILNKNNHDVFVDKKMTLDSLKKQQEIIPLKEVITVDQKDIEELDSLGVQLLK